MKLIRKRNNQNVGIYYIELTATDMYEESISVVFSLDVININDAPYVNIPLLDQEALIDNYFIYELEPNTFIDIDNGDVLNYYATLNENIGLPQWLNFDAENLIFSGTPTYNDEGVYSIRVDATDISGAKVSDVFDCSVYGFTDINGNLLNTVMVYPNPSNGFFVINVNQETKTQYQVFIMDNTGKSILHIYTSSDKSEIDLAGYASGIYQIKIILSDKVYNKKIIIQ